MNATFFSNTTEDHFQDSGVGQMIQEPDRIMKWILIPLVLFSNVMSLAAILSTKGRLSSHFCFLVSLTFSDLLVAISTCLFSINEIMNPVYDTGFGSSKSRIITWCSVVILKALNTTGLLVTLLSLMGMSIDAYIAILRPSYYMSQRNRQRSICLVVTLWVTAFVCGFSDLIFSSYGFVVKNMRVKYNYCEFTYISLYQDEYIVFAMVLLCLATMSYLYCRVYASVKNRPRPGSTLHHQQQRNSSNRERRVLITTVIILLTFGVCFVPLCVLNISLVINAKVNVEWLVKRIQLFRAAEKHLFNLFLLNGIIDPIIYTIRIPEVQMAYRKILCAYRNPRSRIEEGLCSSTMLFVVVINIRNVSHVSD
ncbi:hypothetical protein CAPTEDRAFT_196596 [Capitella teleta]|uniref:G-protein coupled receptors family 1 profile domain-containing protein n=1 Tax=Capitella teleta TaxID=283909 RepID=R7U649_CAPTE|nr:hypothetical protein CAPTEDRAFT_196596 [Capitella teleta]|eukprot:ELU01840.1 hypothetical protein CAPTEDRAFT_196596 [Capitella teleta]